MGSQDIGLKSYLEDTRRYADLWNGGVYGGRQMIHPEELEEITPVLPKADKKVVVEGCPKSSRNDSFQCIGATGGIRT